MIENRINKQTIVIILVVIVAISFWSGAKYAQWRLMKKPLEIVQENKNMEVEEQIQEEVNIYVHIAGAVKNPGVYKLPEGARLEEALKLAQPTEDAKVDKYLNRAAVLTDGEKVYVPKEGENAIIDTSTSPKETSQPTVSKGKININKASLEQLESLTGIGPSKAQAVLDYRSTHGGFSKIDEIMNVKGIGQATFEKIKNQITVN